MLKLLLVYQPLLSFSFFFIHIFKLKAKIQQRHPQTPCSSVNMRSMEIQSHTTRRELCEKKRNICPHPISKKGSIFVNFSFNLLLRIISPFPHPIKLVNIYAYFVNKEMKTTGKKIK